jgi:diguanylate cyclase (GGDEF)-like protein
MTPRILLAGFDAEIASWLQDRFEGVSVPHARTGQELVDQLEGGASLLVLDHQLKRPNAMTVLRLIRQRSTNGEIPVLYCIDQKHRKHLAPTLVDVLGVNRLLFHPVDKDELARQVAALAGLADAHDEASARRERTSRVIAAVWERNRATIIEQVEVLEDAVASLLEGNLEEDLRRTAQSEAHKLAGSVGTFGFAEGSRIAREMELTFQDASLLDEAHTLRLSELVVQLRDELEHAPLVDASEEVPSRAEDSPLLLICSADDQLNNRLGAEAATRGMRIVSVSSVAAAGRAARVESPDVALLDLTLDKSRSEKELALIERLSGGKSPTAVLVFTSSDTFTDRVEVARRGGKGFLDRSLPARAAIDAIERHVAVTKSGELSVLAVDDDPGTLEMLAALLEPKGLAVTCLKDPTKFWNVLEESSPDLLLLDLEMPNISGLELCRVVRNDPRWAGLPILLLTAHQEAEIVNEVFAAGADDYLTKPVVGPEVITRINNRLERMHLYRSVVETDSLTGVANRRKSTQVLDGYLKLAERYNQPLCVALLDVDNLRSVNDRHGHGAGDRALRKLGEVMRKTFRGEDIVARWAGDEFVLGMYGMLRDDGVQRTAEMLEDYRPIEFVGPDGSPFRLTFSAGVAQFPEDGADLQDLYRAADEAMRQAKTSGRDRVLPAGWDPERGAVVERNDVVLVEDDVALGQLLMHSLETRGYKAHWVRDGAEAVEVLGGPKPQLRARVVLLDVNLPGLDGLGVLRRLSQNDGLRGTRVIMLTVRANELEVLKALELGAFDHVAKPFSVPVLMQRIRRALGSSR